MRSSKSKQNLKSKLEAVHLENSTEQDIITSALSDLSQGQKENVVLSNVKNQLRKLALNRELSDKGVDFYTKLARPNINVDTALSSMNWFH